MTVLNHHIMRNTPNDPIAVELSHRYPAHRNTIRFVQPNGSVVECPLVDHLIVVFVAVNGEVFDEDVRDAGALEQGKIGGDLRIALKVEALLQAAIQLEAIA